MRKSKKHYSWKRSSGPQVMVVSSFMCTRHLLPLPPLPIFFANVCEDWGRDKDQAELWPRLRIVVKANRLISDVLLVPTLLLDLLLYWVIITIKAIIVEIFGIGGTQVDCLRQNVIAAHNQTIMVVVLAHNSDQVWNMWPFATRYNHCNEVQKSEFWLDNWIIG